MTHSNDENDLKKLYQKSNQDVPPAALDHLILQHAKQSNQVNRHRKNWRPWLAAASVVLVMPLIWLLVQNEQLLEQTKSSSSQLEVSRPQAAKPAQPAKELRKSHDQVITPEPVLEEALDSVPVEDMSVPASAADMAIESDDTQEYSQNAPPDQKIRVTGSRIKREEAESESVSTNRELLLNEFKAKKKSLKQNNLDPILALEVQQFNQYLEQGQIERATQLLQEMMEREPDFDYQELEQRLADADSD